jgi:hypothetical protein
VIPRSVGYLLVGVALLVLVRWTLAYLLTPAFFRPGIPQVVVVIAVVAAIVGLGLRRVRG